MATVNIVSAPAVAALFPSSPGTKIRNRRFLVAASAGQSVYYDPTTGSCGLTNTSVGGQEQHRGIVLEAVGAGGTASVMEEGEMGGFDLSAVNADSILYAQDTAGAIGTTAGTKAVPIGRVVVIPELAGGRKALDVGWSKLANY